MARTIDTQCHLTVNDSMIMSFQHCSRLLHLLQEHARRTSLSSPTPSHPADIANPTSMPTMGQAWALPATPHNDQRPMSKMSTSTIHDEVRHWTPLPFVCYNTRQQYTRVHSLHLHTAVLTSQYCTVVSFDARNAIARFPGQLWHPTCARVGAPLGFVKPLP